MEWGVQKFDCSGLESVGNVDVRKLVWTSFLRGLAVMSWVIGFFGCCFVFAFEKQTTRKQKPRK